MTPVFHGTLEKGLTGRSAPAQMLVCLGALAGSSEMCACVRPSQLTTAGEPLPGGGDLIQGPREASHPGALGR